MNKLEFMRRAVIVLLLWNVLLTAGLLININNQQEEKLNNEICMLEEIPMEELQ
jgi:invasion protein IalB